MILNQLEDWVGAAAARAGGAPRLLKAARALDAGDGGWDAVVDSEAPGWLLGLRYRGGGGHAAFLKRAGALLGARWSGPAPAAGCPWLSLSWDARSDRLVEARAVLGAGAGAFRRVAADGATTTHALSPFSGSLARAKPVRDLLGPFSKLCPIAGVVTGWEEAGGRRTPLARWGIVLERPVSWPRFMGLDLAKAFTERSSLLSYLALNRRVGELELEGGRVAAYVRA